MPCWLLLHRPWRAQAAAVINDEGEPNEEDDHGYTAELRELAAIEDFNADEMPSKEALDLIDQYMTTAEDYVTSVRGRVMCGPCVRPIYMPGCRCACAHGVQLAR